MHAAHPRRAQCSEETDGSVARAYRRARRAARSRHPRRGRNDDNSFERNRFPRSEEGLEEPIRRKQTVPEVTGGGAMYDSRILAGRSILVTGGGSGLGLAMAAAFASYGARVTIAGRKKERLEAALPRIAAAAREGGEADGFAADVRDPEQVERLVGHAVARFGKLDALVNNAAGNFLAFSEDLTPNG